MELPLTHASGPSIPEAARLDLALKSVKANTRRVRQTWGPGLTGLEWHNRARWRLGARRRVLLLLDGKTLVAVSLPTRRPSRALDPVGWTLWEARLLWAMATAKLDRQALAQHRDNRPDKQLRLGPRMGRR